jgi:hypothetical protein
MLASAVTHHHDWIMYYYDANKRSPGLNSVRADRLIVTAQFFHSVMTSSLLRG